MQDRNWDRVFEGNESTANQQGPVELRVDPRTDERIHEEICEVLRQNDEIDVSDVEVLVMDGEVTLTGMVESRQARHVIEDVVESVRGVEQVFNHLRVQRAGGQRAA